MKKKLTIDVILMDLPVIKEHFALVRDSADALRDYAYRAKRGEIKSIHHLANAVIKIANQIAKEKK